MSVHVVAAAAKVRSVRAGDKTVIGLRSGDRPHAGVPASGSKTQKRRVEEVDARDCVAERLTRRAAEMSQAQQPQ